MHQPPPLPPPPLRARALAAAPWRLPDPLRLRIAGLYLLLALLHGILYLQLRDYLTHHDWLGNAVAWDPSGLLGVPLALFGAGFVWGLSWYCACCGGWFLVCALAAACSGSLSLHRALALFGCCLPPAGTLACAVIAHAVFRAPPRARASAAEPGASTPAISGPR